jgi:hypothetical protein
MKLLPAHCPVCHGEIKQSPSLDVLMCQKTQKMQLPKEKQQYQYIDYVCVTENKIIIYELYEFPPYLIQLWYPNKKGRNFFKTAFLKMEKNREYLPIGITLDSIIQLPWDNPSRVLEKINLYLTFS